MKPIKLIISAFGPYAGLMPEIEFEQFEQKGLFLVTGETGAGKTMIFDAICFALFGTASGQWRDVKNLRSEYADEKTATFVDFHFSHQGRIYHVWRSPGYMRKKERGQGETEEKPKAVLYQDEIPIADGIQTVSRTIEELLHISEKQFKQIAMIAQGEFRDMLNAKTEERTTILRKIFLTEGYENLTQKLKARMDTANETKKKSANSIVQHFSEISAPSGSSFENSLISLQNRTQAGPDAWEVEELLELIDQLLKNDSALLDEKIVQRDEAETDWRNNLEIKATAEQNNKDLKKLAELLEEQEALSKQREEIDAQEQKLNRSKTATREVSSADIAWQKKCKEVEETEEDIQKQKAEADETAEGVQQAKQTLKEAEETKSEAEALQKKADGLAAEIPQYKEREDLRRAKREQQNRQSALAEEEVQLEEAEQSLKARIRELSETVELLKDSPELLAKENGEQEKITELSNKLRTIMEEKLPEYKNKEAVLVRKQDEFIRAREVYQKASDARIEAETILENCRAGILAEKLQDGKKCPVCGSVHHPEPAALPAESVGEDQVKKLQADEQKKQEEKDRTNTAAEKAKTALELFENQLCENIRECLTNSLLAMEATEDFASLSESVKPAQEELARKQKESAQKIDALTASCNVLKETREKLAKAQGSESESLEERRRKYTADQTELVKLIAETDMKLENLKGLSYETFEEALEEKQRAETVAESIISAIKTAEDELQKAENSKTAAESGLNLLNKNLVKLKADADDLLGSLEALLCEKGFGTVEEMRSFVVTEELLRDMENAIHEYHQRVATNQSMLSEALQRAEGKEPVDLEALMTSCMEQEQKLQNLNEEVKNISYRMNINGRKRESIAAQRESLLNARRENRTAERMYKLVRGTTGNGKVTLEQYVQAAGFDSIIAAANRRLDPMSGGQFQLRRQDSSRSIQSNTFLDLEVIDSWTGRARPVGNISGGESFKASLSLALGLADTVSSNLGGVQLDALFVDEGFGTLDGKSIDNALDILNSLSQKNRLVGIISHREELKAAISNKIVVTKSRTGSNITIDVDK